MLQRLTLMIFPVWTGRAHHLLSSIKRPLHVSFGFAAEELTNE